MKTRKLGKLEVSELGFGCMSLAINYGPAAPIDEAIKVIREAHNKGVNCSLSSIAEHSFQGITPSPLRGKVSPMCPVQCVTYVSGRSFSRLPSVVPQIPTPTSSHFIAPSAQPHPAP
jgi:hypothetical protein